MQRLARTICERRVALGLSQADLAYKAGISRRRVQQIESAEALNPSLKTVFSLAKALQLELADIIALPPERSARRKKSAK